MRILKRNLAFMLAMIMALSLTAFAGYEDYPDVDELTYVEAVDVLTELGIVEGSNGKLLPTGNLTRAQAAKLIAYTMLGKKSADALQADTATFVDVPTYHWAAGYVEYCANEGIVGGNGDGTFAPEQNVTGSAFAKMLLCAVGYGQNGEFTGPTWDATVNAMATKLGVFDNNLDIVFKNAVTREEAFLYTFNALTKVMEVTYSADADEYYAGTVFNSIKGFDFDETLGAKLYDLNTREGKDAFKREGHYWYKNNKKITDLYANEADATYTAAVKSGTIFTDLDLDESTMATVYRNGVKGEFQIKKNSTTKIGDNGVLIEAYVDADMDVTLIVIDTYLAEVTNVRNDDLTLAVWFDGNGTTETKTFTTDMDLEEGDYVLVTIVDGDIVTMKDVEIVNGELDARGVTSTYTKMEGTKYSHSAHLDQDEDSAVYVPEFDVEMVMMLDEYGYMIGLMPADEAAKLDGYVLVTDSEVQAGGLASTDKALVEVLWLDGTGYSVENLLTQRVKDNGERVTQWKNVDGEWEDIDADEADMIPYGFYGYYMTEDDEIVLMDLGTDNRKEAQVLSKADTATTNVATNKVFGNNETATVIANVGDVDGQEFKFGNLQNTVNLVLDNDTVLNMVTSKDVETFEGYKNIVIDEQDVDALVIYSGRTVKEIYVVDGSLYADNYAYYTGTEIEERAGKYYIYLYEDGNLVSYRYHTDEEPEYDGVYKIEVEDGFVTMTPVKYELYHNATVEEDRPKNFDIQYKNDAVSGEYTHAVSYITYADGVEIYDLTDVEDGVAAKLDAVAEGDTVVFLENEDGKGIVATHIWVLKHYGKAPVENDTTVTADVVFTKNENTWRFDFTDLKKDDVVVITAYNYAEGIDGVYATYSFTQAANGTNGYQQTYNVDAQMSFVVTINGKLVHDGPVYSFVKN